MRRVFCFFPLFLFALLPSLAAAADLSVGQSLDFALQSEDEKASFTIAHPGDRYLAIQASFAKNSNADASIHVQGSCAVKVEQCEWTRSFERNLFAHDGPVSIADDLLPLKGAWKITVTTETAPVSGKLQLIDLGPVPAPELVSAMGLIKIKKPGVASISAFGSVYHPDFLTSEEEHTGTLNSDGDILIPVPAGLWKLQFTTTDFLTSLQSSLIPVYGGKTTEVENWPQPPKLPENQAGSASGETELHIRSLAPLAGDRVQIRFATPHWKGTLHKTDLDVTEGGMPGKVLAVGPVASPLDLTILLDSSGSMKKDMQEVLSAAEKFIRRLPPDARITLVDFDTKPRRIAAEGREDLLRALRRIRANGATCLNDSVMLGLSQTQDKSRAAIILFTDGFDANANDTGPGSVTTPDEMFKAASQAGTPIFTIGFGSKPDDVTLRRLAKLSGGIYRKADKTNLDAVFAQLSAILGRDHQMVYQRPGVLGNSAAPVISIVLDVSGSMDSPPTEEGCDFRLERAKAILRRLIHQLPENAIVQLATYNHRMNVVQVFTSDKMQLIASLAPVRAIGGTKTFSALSYTFEMLRNVPSDRRYILFITDAGLELKETEVDKVSLLGSIKDAGIRTTWIGMVGEEQRRKFDLAARLCGGRAVVSTDFAAVQEALENLGREVASGTAADNRIPVRLTLTKKERNGNILVMSAAERFKLPSPPIVSKAVVNGLKISFAEMPPQLKRYSYDLSRNLYGNSVPRSETMVTQRFPIGCSVSNRAMRLTVEEMVLLKSLKGISANAAALKLKFENLLPEQEVAVLDGADMQPAALVDGAGKEGKTIRAIPPYLIPDLRSHLFLAWNKHPAAPFSDLSWLVERPLVTLDDESLLVSPGKPVTGYLVFPGCPDETLKSAALTFYDTRYGNLTLPLLGVINPAATTAKINRLPTAVAKLSDAFNLGWKGFSDTPNKDDPRTVIRTIDLEMQSRVQAHLELDPAERFSLLLGTRFGTLLLPLSNRTHDIPGGWYAPRLLVPGSHNELRQAYVIPSALAAAQKGVLRMDVAGGDVLLSAGDGPVPAAQPLAVGSGDKISLALNRWHFQDNTFFLDVTLRDTRDGQGTAVELNDLCYIRKGAEKLRPIADSSAYLLELPPAIAVPDGYARRGLIRISCDVDPDAPEPMTLESDLFSLKVPLQPIAEKDFDRYLLTFADQYTPRGRTDNDAEIREKARRILQQRLAGGWRKPGSTAGGAAGLDGIVRPKPRILPPVAVTTAGAARWQAMLQMDEASFLKELAKVRCIPSDLNLTGGAYAPEAVLTQGWGTPMDLLAMVKGYYKSCGRLYTERVAAARLSDAGRQELFRLTGWQTDLEWLPVLESGRLKLVFPFLKDYRTLPNLFQGYDDDADSYQNNQGVGLYVQLVVRPIQAGQAAQVGAMSNALGGGGAEDERQTVPIFQADGLRLADLSRGPVDLVYTASGEDKALKARLETPAGTIADTVEPLQLTANQVLEEHIEVRLEDDTYRFVRVLQPGEHIEDTFRSIAVNPPDLPAAAAESIREAWQQQKTRQVPALRSVAKWYTRSLLYQFLALHSASEQAAAAQAGVKIGRPGRKPRVIMATLSKQGDIFRTTLDLSRLTPVVQGTEQAVAGFNVFMGLTNSLIEDRLTGGGMFTRWFAGPQQLCLVAPDEMAKLLQALEKYPLSATTRTLLEEAGGNGYGVIFPSYAPVRNGRPRLSWLQFNPETWEMIAVLDTGEHGAMVEETLTNFVSDISKVGVGFLLGIDTSLWAMTTFSLVTDDYAAIVKAAKAYCLALAKHLDGIGDPLSFSLGALSGNTAGGVSATHKKVKVSVGLDKIEPGKVQKLFAPPVLGLNASYKDGFEMAVKAYFGE